MIITFDCETRGLFGDIFLAGMYDGTNFQFVEPEELLKVILRYQEPVYIYVHNLDFDFSKLWRRLEGRIEVDWDKTLIIHHNLVRVKLAGRKIYFCDSHKLFPSSLESLSRDFDLKTPKMNLEEYLKEKGYKDKEDFFKHVSSDDNVLREYLKADCLSLYELIKKAIDFSGLSEEEFCQCPTLPSLAMKIYQKMCPEEYAILTEERISKELEEFGRNAYIGARVEVVKPILKWGFHYDVNSLYPYVMKVNSYPIGRYSKYTGSMAEFAYKVFKEGGFRHGLVKAKVYVPENIYIPPLPYRTDKLMFPVGRFEGTWTAEELSMAEQYGVLVKPEEAIFWKEGEFVFKRFIEVMEKEKKESKGARRNFFKLIQNSLYGKFGMRRERESYCSEDKAKKLEEKGIPYLRIKLECGKEILQTFKKVRANYIRPHIAAYVTSYARMYLYQGIMNNPEGVYYYDTDSLVIDYILPNEMVDEKEYGKWKLEREIVEGIFLQPKLYAEKSITGEQVLKSKGLISDFRKKMDYSLYEAILEAVLMGQDEFILYKDILSRRKFITALKQGVNLDEPVIFKKKINLKAKQKREIDYRANTSKPLAVYTW